MKKKSWKWLMSAAVLLLTGLALAQNSVTLEGTIEVDNTDNEGNPTAVSLVVYDYESDGDQAKSYRINSKGKGAELLLSGGETVKVNGSVRKGADGALQLTVMSYEKTGDEGSDTYDDGGEEEMDFQDEGGE